MIEKSPMLSLMIPIEPKTKKNHQQIIRAGGRPIPIQSKAYRDYEKEAVRYLPEFHIDKPVNVSCQFYMKTHRRVDLVNLLQAVDDILVKAGTLEDDNSKIIVSHDGSRVLHDKARPRTEIVITQI